MSKSDKAIPDADDLAAEIAALRAEVARLSVAAQAAQDQPQPDGAERLLREASALMLRAEGMIRANPALAVAVAAGLGFLAGLARGGHSSGGPPR